IFFSILKFLRGDVTVDFHSIRVDGDDVSIPDQSYRPARVSFGRHMPDHEPVRAPRKPSIRDKGHIGTQPGANYNGGRLKHFGHSGPAFGTYVPDHNYIALLDLLIFHGLVGLSLTVKHPGRSGKRLSFLS